MSEFQWPVSDLDDEFEEITSDEVDQIVLQLEQLMASVQSENIRVYLEEAADRIHQLIYDDVTSEADLDEALPADLDLDLESYREEAA